MPLSKYARKQMIKNLARNYTDAEWETLINDSEFSRLVFCSEPDLLQAVERAKTVLSVKPKQNKVFQSTVGDALRSLQSSPA